MTAEIPLCGAFRQFFLWDFLGKNGWFVLFWVPAGGFFLSAFVGAGFVQKKAPPSFEGRVFFF